MHGWHIFLNGTETEKTASFGLTLLKRICSNDVVPTFPPAVVHARSMVLVEPYLGQPIVHSGKAGSTPPRDPSIASKKRTRLDKGPPDRTLVRQQLARKQLRLLMQRERASGDTRVLE